MNWSEHMRAQYRAKTQAAKDAEWAQTSYKLAETWGEFARTFTEAVEVRMNLLDPDYHNKSKEDQEALFERAVQDTYMGPECWDYLESDLTIETLVDDARAEIFHEPGQVRRIGEDDQAGPPDEG